MFTVFANIISCSFSHLYIIIRAGLCSSMWSCGYSPRCCADVLRGPKTAAESLESKCEMIRFHLESQMSSSCLCPFCFQSLWLMWWAGRASKNMEGRHLSFSRLRSCNSACLEILRTVSGKKSQWWLHYRDDIATNPLLWCFSFGW